ncbi:MAG: copper chaperone PCu(A)C [Thermoanaerobaculia bacterium]
MEEAWVRLVPPSAAVTAGFLRVRNAGDRPVEIVGASSDVAKTAELHVMSEENGMMTMRRAASVEVPARGSLELAPGGAHLMLIGLERPLSPDETVRLRLDLANGEHLEVEAAVRREPPGEAGR